MDTDMNTAEEPKPQQQKQQPALSTGLDPKLAALLAYLFWIVGGIIFISIEKEDKYVRFHAAQSIVFHGLFMAIWIAMFIIGFIIGFGMGVTGSLALVGLVTGLFRLVGLIIWLAYLVLGILLLVKAYTGYDKGETYKLPIIGGIAEKIAG